MHNLDDALQKFAATQDSQKPKIAESPGELECPATQILDKDEFSLRIAHETANTPKKVVSGDLPASDAETMILGEHLQQSPMAMANASGTMQERLDLEMADSLRFLKAKPDVVVLDDEASPDKQTRQDILGAEKFRLAQVRRMLSTIAWIEPFAHHN